MWCVSAFRRTLSAGPMRPAALLFGAALLAAVGSAPVLAEDAPNGAAIQWAQQILDEKGFYQGRASGKMDSATAAAIAAYQKSVGLKATGRLDQRTIDKLMEGRTEQKTVGNLADPTRRAKPSQPILKESDVRPMAAPTVGGIQRGEGSEQSILGGVGLEPRPTASPATQVQGVGLDGQPQPTAAPRSGVEVMPTGGGASAIDFSNLTAPDWLRQGLIGAVGLLLAGMGLVWWWSGRSRRSRLPLKQAPRAGHLAGARQEPSFGPPPPRPGERREPSFGPPPGSSRGGVRAGRF